MRGKLVIVRGFNDEPLIRKVWDVGQRVVYVTDEKNFDFLSHGQVAIPPVGALKQDVFEYDGGLTTEIDWSRLPPWSETSQRIAIVEH